MLAYDCNEHQRLTESLRSDNVVCDFSVASNKYAWINEQFQHLSADQVYADADNKDQSQLYKRRTQAYCHAQEDMGQMLLGGRNCTSSMQCKSMQCRDDENTPGVKKCFGRSEEKTCF